MKGVNNYGEVDSSVHFSKWDEKMTIQDSLAILRKEMESSDFKKLKQPEEFSTY